MEPDNMQHFDGFTEDGEKPFSLQGLINQHVAKLGEEKKVYDHWTASAIGSCPRAHYLHRLGVEETSPPDARLQRVFGVGNHFHDWIQEIANQQGYAEQIEYELFDEELDLRGRCDLIVEAGGKRILYDIKSQHSQAFWWMLKKAKGYKKKDGTVVPPTPINQQKPEHRMQLGAYMTLLKRQGEPVDEGRMLYVSKDDLCMEEITFFLTPELEQSVLDELTMLNKHWAEKTLPPCTCADMYDGKGVDYCNYKEGSSCCSEKLAEKKLTQGDQ